MGDWTVRPLLLADVNGAASLQRLCFPDPFPAELLFQPGHFLRHLQVFPPGQFVAVANGSVVGSATNMLVSLPSWKAHLPWSQAVGGLDLERHDPAGTVLYGVDVSVHPDWRGKGVARSLYAARYDLVRQLRLDLFGTVCRMPDFAASPVATAGEYSRQVAAGERVDVTMTPLLKLGLNFVDVIENYMDDEESRHAGAVMEWRP